MLRLPELQHEFFRIITCAHDPVLRSESLSLLASEICGDSRLDAEERLEIYARMYCARLIGVLIEDFPRVVAILDPDAFTDIAHDYVAAHPSTRPSLRWFGGGFADFLGRWTKRPTLPFLADLARLEWTRLAVFDAPDVELLDVEALRRLPAEAWPHLRLRLAPTVEILPVGWPVHRIWESDSLPGDWKAEATCLRVWRQGDKVYQVGMDVAERTALAHVQAGDEFGELCRGLATVVSAESAPEMAGALVLRWLEDGVLVGGKCQ